MDSVRRSTRVVFSIPTRAPAIALTIDDGPDSAETPLILDALARHNARATFFLLASHVPGNESLLARMRNESHEIANHTLYDRPSILMSSRELEDDLRKAHGLLSPFGPVRWFRPGSGFFTPRMVRTAASLGYGTALGDVYPFDHAVPSHRFHAWFIQKRARPGSIVVLHDGQGRGRRTAATLEIVLPTLRQRGFRAVALSELVVLAKSPQERP